MTGYIDIHSHLLPEIDDGAKDFDTSMEMFRMAAANGITGMILTPHYKPMHHNARPEKIADMIEQMKVILYKEGINIQLYAGNELYYHSEVILKLEQGGVCTMAGSDYVLLEFNPMDEYDYIRNGIYQVVAGGYRPILAHAERYGCMQAQRERIEDLIEMGCYIQLNANSIMGQYGFLTKQFTKKLLKQHLVHFVATDAHDTGKRGPRLLECGKYIRGKFGEAYAKELLYTNPMCVIHNEYI